MLRLEDLDNHTSRVDGLGDSSPRTRVSNRSVPNPGVLWPVRITGLKLTGTEGSNRFTGVLKRDRHGVGVPRGLLTKVGRCRSASVCTRVPSTERVCPRSVVSLRRFKRLIYGVSPLVTTNTIWTWVASIWIPLVLHVEDSRPSPRTLRRTWIQDVTTNRRGNVKR